MAWGLLRLPTVKICGRLQTTQASLRGSMNIKVKQQIANTPSASKIQCMAHLKIQFKDIHICKRTASFKDILTDTRRALFKVHRMGNILSNYTEPPLELMILGILLNINTTVHWRTDKEACLANHQSLKPLEMKASSHSFRSFSSFSSLAS
jgi:hypothetical protein